MNAMKKTVVELFAGVGGFRVGLNDIHSIDKNGRAIENRDWEFVWANQWEPSTKTQHAYECYKLRFGADDSIQTKIFLLSINRHYPITHFWLVDSLAKIIQ